jgi:pSer/pThr/pTyr-binding forkhead associated (FHA) protein
MENQEFWLEVIKGRSRGQTFRLLSEVITVGRRLTAKERKMNWLLLDEPSLSRIHAVLQWNSEIQSFELFHKSSARPTMVNNKKVDQVALSSQDRIQMGDIVFRFWEGPIEKKFDYYQSEEDQEEPHTAPARPSFTPLDLQHQQKMRAQEEAQDFQGHGMESDEAAVREERRLVKAGEREVQKVQEFKPLVFTQFSESEKEEAPIKDKVFCSQKDQKKEASEFTPLRFSGEKSAAAPPERESPLKKTSKVEQYMNGRGEKASPATIKPVNLIKDTPSQAAQKGGKVFGASDESAASFTPLSFSKEEKREVYEDPRETRMMLNRQSGGGGGEAPAPFKPVSLIQQRSVIDSQSYKGKGRIFGSQNREDEDGEESEFQGQEFRNGSSYLSSSRPSEEALRYRDEEDGKDGRQASVKTFNLLKPQSPKMASQSYGEAGAGSPVESRDEPFPSQIHDEALEGEGQFYEGLGEIPSPPIDEAKKDSEQPAPGYRPTRIRSKRDMRYSGWNKDLSSRERNAARAGAESEAKPAGPESMAAAESPVTSAPALGESLRMPTPAQTDSELNAAGHIPPAEPVTGLRTEAAAETQFQCRHEASESELVAEYESTSLTPSLDLMDYDEGPAPAAQSVISGEEGEEIFEMLTEASLQPALQIDEAPRSRLLSPRNPQQAADRETGNQIPTGEMLQPHLVPAELPPARQLFKSRSQQSQETAEKTSLAAPGEPGQKPLESPTLFSQDREQQPLESPTLFSSERVQPLESPTAFSPEEFQAPMESPTSFSAGEFNAPMESPTVFSADTIENIWTTLVPERALQQAQPSQPWAPVMQESTQQPQQFQPRTPPAPESAQQPQQFQPWTPPAPESTQQPQQFQPWTPPAPESTQQPQQFQPWTPPAPESTQQPGWKNDDFSLELPELAWTPTLQERTPEPLQPSLQFPMDMPEPSWASQELSLDPLQPLQLPSDLPGPSRTSQELSQDPLSFPSLEPFDSMEIEMSHPSGKTKKGKGAEKIEQAATLMAPWDQKSHAVEKSHSAADGKKALAAEKAEPPSKLKLSFPKESRAEKSGIKEGGRASDMQSPGPGRLRAPWDKALAEKRENASEKKKGCIPPPPPSLNRPAAVFGRSPEKRAQRTVDDSRVSLPKITGILNRDTSSTGHPVEAVKAAEPIRPAKQDGSGTARHSQEAGPSQERGSKTAGLPDRGPVPSGKAGHLSAPPPGPEPAPSWDSIQLKTAPLKQEPSAPAGAGLQTVSLKGMDSSAVQKAGYRPPAPQQTDSAPSWDSIPAVRAPQKPEPAASAGTGQKTASLKGLDSSAAQKAGYRPPAPQQTDSAPSWDSIPVSRAPQRPEPADSAGAVQKTASLKGMELPAPQQTDPVPSWDSIPVSRAPQKPEPVTQQGGRTSPPQEKGAERRETGSAGPDAGRRPVSNDEAKQRSGMASGPLPSERGGYAQSGGMPDGKAESDQRAKPQKQNGFDPYNMAPAEVMSFLLDDDGKKSSGAGKPTAVQPAQNVPYDSFKARMSRQMEGKRTQEKTAQPQTEPDEPENITEEQREDGRPLFHSWKPPQGFQPGEAAAEPPGKVKVTPSPAAPQARKAEQGQMQPDLWEILLLQGSGEEEGKYFPINKSSITVGKSDENDIVIHDTQLAAVHLKIYCEGTTFFLQKMERTQPVFINGKILATSSGKVIMDGDLIQISGRTKLVFRKKRS